jgi:cell division protein FtsB
MAAIIALAVLAVTGEHGMLHLIKLREEQHGVERFAFQLQQSTEHLRQHIWKVQNDDRYIERLARDRLGLVRPDEMVYRVEAPLSARTR